MFLSGLFCMLTLGADPRATFAIATCLDATRAADLLRSTENVDSRAWLAGGLPHGLRYLAVVVCFALGLLAKPVLVTLPFVLLLLDYWPLGRTVRATSETRLAPSAAGSTGTFRRGVRARPPDGSPFPRVLCSKRPRCWPS